MIKAITFDLWNTILAVKDYRSATDYRDSRIQFLMKVLKNKKITCTYETIQKAYFSARDTRFGKSRTIDTYQQ